MAIKIDAEFETGSIEVLSAERPDEILVKLKDDNAAAVRQWFYFAVRGAAGSTVKATIKDIHMTNTAAGLIGMPVMWEGFKAWVSVDGDVWSPATTTYDGRDLVMTVPDAPDLVYFANYAPYTMQRHRQLIDHACASPMVKHLVLGQTPDGQPLDCLQIGDPAGKKACWIVARQHPAETQGSWCVEGLVERLVDSNDAVAADLLKRAVFYVMPNINPDGVRRGNTRTNALGVNLNRTWIEPSPETSPETYLVKSHMLRTGLDFGLDIHGWGGTHNFAVGAYNSPSVTQRQTAIWKKYEAALARASQDFEVGWPYPGGGPKPGEADCSMSWNCFTEEFGAIGILYELLYKDNASRPTPEGGWSPDRCLAFGAATIDAIAAIVEDL